MFLPKPYSVTDNAAITAFITANPFAALTTAQGGDLQANHLPLQLVCDEHQQPIKLQGHLARLNPLVKLIDAPVSCLTLFQGADCYISPNWYPTKHDTGKAVPTWDYEVVQVRGRLTLIDDSKWLLAFLNGLTDRHEAAQSSPWKISDAPGDYIDKMLKAIIGLEIEIEAVAMKSKLNQNHPASNQRGIVTALGKVLGVAPDDKQAQIAARIKQNLESD